MDLHWHEWSDCKFLWASNCLKLRNRTWREGQGVVAELAVRLRSSQVSERRYNAHDIL